MNGKSLIVELVGPAGAGKTTIRNALIKSNCTIRFGPIPKIRDIRNIPFFLWNLVLLLPTFFAIYHRRKHVSLTPSFMIRMVILNGWSRQLNAPRLKDTSVLILDQGPVYMLAELLRHGPPNFRNSASKWWERVCADWANVLDMVICLDTQDATLLQRIRSREKNHGIKQNHDQWAAQFLFQSREAQTEVLKSMADKPRKVKVMQIDTSRCTASESVQKISNLFCEKKK